MTSGPSSAIQRLKLARMVPPLADHGPFHRSAGVFDNEGGFCDLANVRRGEAFELTPRRQEAVPPLRLAGRHLYGGQLNHHFGHFLCETLARLWALAEVQEIDSILLLPRRSGSHGELQAFQQSVFALLNLPVQIRIVTEPTEVEELIVPEQAFGIGQLSAGTPAFRSWIHENFAPDVAADGPERLYLSREAMGLRAGAVLNEAALAENLAREGYELFSPEKHDLKQQIARYRAARQILGIEGSALHLYGFVGHSGQRAGVVARRADLDASETIARQLRAFCGAETHVFAAITREWDVHDAPIRSSKSLAELDMVALGAALAATGFVSNRAWSAAPANAERHLERVLRRTGRSYSLIAGAGNKV